MDSEKIFRKGFRAVIFDIDMTLVPHGEDSTPEIDALFKNIDTPYICDADKPAPAAE